MAETIVLPESGTKAEFYELLLPQIKSVIEVETDAVANLANVAAMLKEAFDFFWVGFFLVKEGELVLGPFQGPLACTRIQKGRGVCGAAWSEDQIIVVDNVEEFPGHISCNSASKSEIVVPIHNKAGEVVAVLDIDSDELGDFDEDDAQYLGELAEILSEKLS